MVAVGVCGAAVALTLSGSLLPTNLPERTLGVIVLGVAMLTTGLVLLSLWQVASQLRASITEARAANVAHQSQPQTNLEEPHVNLRPRA